MYELLSELSQEESIAKIRNQISNHDLIGVTAKNIVKSPGTNLTTGEFQIRKSQL